LLLRLAAAEPTPRVRATAIATLSALDSNAASGAAATFLTRAEDDAAVSEIFTAFLQRQGGAETLADSLGANPPNPHAADIGLRTVNASGRRDESLARVLAQAAGLRAQNSQMTAKEIAVFRRSAREGRCAAWRGNFQRPRLAALHVTP
jgi:hypothetical protein